jgi:hypothetical protein
MTGVIAAVIYGQFQYILFKAVDFLKYGLLSLWLFHSSQLNLLLFSKMHFEIAVKFIINLCDSGKVQL